MPRISSSSSDLDTINRAANDDDVLWTLKTSESQGIGQKANEAERCMQIKRSKG